MVDVVSAGSILDGWDASHRVALGRAHLKARHHLAEHPLFQDEAILRVLDTHPEDHLLIYTMGTDPAEPDDFTIGLRNGLSAEALLESVKAGRLWLNIIRMQQFHDDYRALLNEIYDEVEAATPGFKTFQRSANLLLSSPAAMVYYHADAPLNMLWHLRGQKRLWVYPTTERFLPQDALEMIFTGETEEEVPYDPAFDAEAAVYDLAPGEMLTWPQNTPHRVENVSGMNVSFSTEHHTQESLRKQNTYLANHYLRRWFKLPCTSTETDGNIARMKRVAYRLGERYLPQVDEYENVPGFVLDPEADDRVAPLSNAG